MALQQFNAGSAIVTDGEIVGAVTRPSVSADPAPRMRLLSRLAMLQNLYILEGGDGDCPDETDLDLVQDNPLQ